MICESCGKDVSAAATQRPHCGAQFEMEGPERSPRAKGEIPEDLDAMDAQVDRIWPELRFEAAWQSQSERRAARMALERFLIYHVRRDRELVDTEASVGASVDVTTPGGGSDTVRLRGFIDRVERDDQGRDVAIDLKNMKRPVADSDVPEHGQLGVYQLILRAGDEPREVGGAALVQLRVAATKDAADPKVQFQEALPSQSPTWVEVKLGEAAHAIRTEVFSATLGSSCRFCAYRTSCPARSDGEQVAP